MLTHGTRLQPQSQLVTPSLFTITLPDMDQAATTPGFRVALDGFSGPLELLLYLIRRNEFESRRVPLSKITNQFLEFLTILQVIDLELSSEFVVVASTLVEMKSREVLPSEDEAAAEADPDLAATAGSPSSEIIRKLLEYRRFRDASEALDRRAAEWQARYPRLSEERPVVGKTPSLDRIKEVELWDLVSAFGRVVQRDEVQTEGHIRYDETPIEVFVEQIGTRVRAEGEVLFTTLFDQETIRARIVGIFLAILELLRHHGYRAVQVGLFGEIRVLPPLAEDREGAADLPSLKPRL